MLPEIERPSIPSNLLLETKKLGNFSTYTKRHVASNKVALCMIAFRDTRVKIGA